MKIPLGSCDNTLGKMKHTRSLVVPLVAWRAARQRRATAGSLGCTLQHLLPLPWVTEELQFPGQQCHLHRHGFILLAVDAEGALSSLRKEESAVAGLETLSTSCAQFGVSHLLTSYGYEISFADSIGLDANVHKVFFARQVKLAVSGCDRQLNRGQLYIFPDLWAHLSGEGFLWLCPE